MKHANINPKTLRTAQLSLLTAISVLFMYFVHIPLIPAISFMKYDPADIPILIGTLLFGTRAGLLVTVAVSVIQGMLVEGGAFDAAMHIFATGTLVILTSVTYKKHRSSQGAAAGLLMGTIGMTVVMFGANLLITPIYLGVTVSSLVPLLPYILLFNLLKAGINSLVSLIIFQKAGCFFGMKEYRLS